MNDGWHQFNDNHGVNNSYPTPIRGLEFHTHGQNFEGPASLKYGSQTLRTMTPGEALYEAAMIEYQQRYGQGQ